MRVSIADLGDDHEPYDICIIGAGTAGPVLATALSGTGLRIALVEAGGEKERKATQDAYQGEVVDPRVHPWLHHFRVRALGGASRIWGGRCIPFDPIDFDERPWVPGPGWPIGYDALLPYYPGAQVALEAGPFDYDPASIFGEAMAEFAAGLDGPVVETRLERFSRPSNMWVRNRAAIEAARDVHLFANTPVTRIALDPAGARVDHVEVAAGAGRRKIRARRHVVAAGGLETVRLLLASSDVRPNGIGNDHDQLGRYYMSHLAATAGSIRFTAPKAVRFDYEREPDGVYVRRRLAIRREIQLREKTMNVIFRTHLPDAADPSHGDPILSAMYLVKDLVLYEYSRKLRESDTGWGHRMRHVGNIARHPLSLASFGHKWVRHRILADRKLPSVVLGPRNDRFALEFHAEQAPNPDSRLSLSNERDGFGMPRLRVDWRPSPIDLESLQHCYRLLAAELARTGTGRLDFDPEDVAAQALAAGAYGGHHLGAARMSSDPRQGVVDADCRVHGVDNLFLASGAVLPTSSQANPTLTIVALTLRLAEMLKRLASKTGS